MRYTGPLGFNGVRLEPVRQVLREPPEVHVQHPVHSQEGFQAGLVTEESQWSANDDTIRAEQHAEHLIAVLLQEALQAVPPDDDSSKPSSRITRAASLFAFGCG
jgi:hypothetical protein